MANELQQKQSLACCTPQVVGSSDEAHLMNIPDLQDLKPGAKLAGANFDGRHWGPLTLDRADLRGADLSKSIFSDGYLTIGEIHTKHHLAYELFASNFRQTDFSDANLMSATLLGCDLQGANLSGARLDGADLRRANLRGANLERASLVGALLSDACLDGSNASGANFRDANFAASRIPESDDVTTYFSSPKYVGLAELQPTSVTGLRLNQNSLSQANTNGVDLSGLNYAD